MTDVFKRFQDLRGEHADRDRRHQEVAAARRGDVHQLLPGLFPEKWPKQATANIVNIASRDVGEMLGPLPAVNCRPRGSTQKALTKATLKNRIAASYVDQSELSAHMASAGDRFASFGHMAFVIEPDYEDNAPCIRVNDFPIGAYYTLDLKGRVKEYYKHWYESAGSLAAKFPEFQHLILKQDAFTGSYNTQSEVEVVKAYYWSNESVGWDEDSQEELFEQVPRCTLFLPTRDDLVLRDAVYHGMTRMPVTIAERPKWDEEVRGQFDEALWVQALRARMELYTMQAADESINAPIQVPADVIKVPTGPRAVIRSNSGLQAQKLRLDVPQGVFQENSRLAQEERVAARYPEGRSGNLDASVITGQGVQALLGTLDTQLKSYQAQVGRAFKNAVSIGFEMDERYFGGETKKIEGTLDGELFEEKYDPAKDIAGDFRVDVTYGFAAGLDPNRALVFLLQLRGDRLVDRDTVMRQMPFDIDVGAMKERIDKEELEDALKQGLFGLAQQIAAPELAGMGVDPRKALHQLSVVIEQREKGKPLHEAISKAFEPTEEELAAQAAQEQAAMSPLDQLVAEDQAALGPAPEVGEVPARGLGSPQAGSTGDIQMLMAGLTQAGNPALQANVSRMRSA